MKKQLLFLSEKLHTDLSYASRNWFWLSVGKLITAFGSFALMLVMARLATKDLVGTYGYVLAMIGALSIFTLPGTNRAIVKAVANNFDGNFIEMVRSKLRWSFWGVLITIGIALYYLFAGNNTLGTLFLVAAICYPFFSTIHFLVNGYWQGRHDFRKAALLQSVFVIISMGLGIFSLLVSPDTITVITVLLVSGAVATNILFLYTYQRLRNREVESSYNHFAKQFSLITIFDTLSIYIDKVILWLFLSPVAVATYMFSTQTIQKVTQLLSVEELVLPKLSSYTEGNIPKKQIMKKVGYMIAVMIPLVILLFFIATPLYNILFPGYEDSIPYFKILLITLLFLPFRIIYSNFIAQLKKRELFIIYFILPIVKIILFILLGLFLGILGVILASVIFVIIQSVIAMIMLYRPHLLQIRLFRSF